MAIKKATTSSAQNSVLSRSVIISCMMLTAIFIASLFLQDSFESYLGKYADEAVVGLMLIALWLVVSSAVRSVNSLTKGIPFPKLVLGGALIGMVSSILTVAFLIVFPNVAKSKRMEELIGASAGVILMMTALSFFIALISVINLRVKNKQLGNLLEILLIGGSIALLIFLSKK